MTEEHSEERLTKMNDRLAELAKLARVDPERQGAPSDEEIAYCLDVEGLKKRLASGAIEPFDRFFAFRCPRCFVAFCFTRHPPDVKVILEWLAEPDGCAMLCARCGKESRYTLQNARAVP